MCRTPPIHRPNPAGKSLSGTDAVGTIQPCRGGRRAGQLSPNPDPWGELGCSSVSLRGDREEEEWPTPNQAPWGKKA